MAPIVELTTCDCSLCVKKNALMTKVHESELEILAGQDVLRLYRWNTHRAQHFFCGECGVYTLHRKRAAPDHYGVNVFCLDGFDLSAILVRATEGMGMTVSDPNPREEWPGHGSRGDPPGRRSGSPCHPSDAEGLPIIGLRGLWHMPSCR